MEILNFKPYHWIEEDVNGLLQLRVWCINRQSERCLLLVRGFRPFVYIELPKSRIPGGWNINSCRVFMDNLKRNYKLPYNYEFVTKKVTMFTNNKELAMVKVSFKSIRDQKSFCYHYANYVLPLYNQTLTILESDIKVVNKYLAVMGINAADWLEVRCQKVLDKFKVSRIEGEYAVVWNEISAVNTETSKDWSAYPASMSMDIECHSHNYKAFPRAKNVKDRIYVICCHFRHLGSNGKTHNYCFVLGDCHDIEGATIYRFNNEIALIYKMFEVAFSLNTVVWLSHNGLGFDWGYIMDKHELSGRTWPKFGALKDREVNLISRTWFSKAYGKVSIIKPEFEGYIDFDFYKYVTRDYRLRKNSLNFCSETFLGDHKEDMPYITLFQHIDYQQDAFKYEEICNIVKAMCEEDISTLNDKVLEDRDKYVRRLIVNLVRDLKVEFNVRELYKHYKDGTFYEFCKEDLNKRLETAKDNMTLVVKYCIQDCVLTTNLTENRGCWDSMISMSSLTQLNVEKIYTSGQQIASYSCIHRAAHMRNMVIKKPPPPKTTKYVGGAVCKPITGLHFLVFTLDFNSLYPSIMIANNLCYTTIIPEEYIDMIPKSDYDVLDVEGEKIYVINTYKGLLPEILDHLLKTRKEIRAPVKSLEIALEKAKEEGDHEKVVKIKRLLAKIDADQKARKVVCNSVYGFTGTGEENGIMPFKAIAKATTALGRQYIKQVGDILIEKYGADLIYGDTDSVMMHVDVNTPEEAIRMALIMECELNGIKPGGKDPEGNVYPEGKPGYFKDGVRIETERLMYAMIAITPKLYVYIEWKPKGMDKETVTDPLGTRERLKMTYKGVPPAKRGTTGIVYKLYTALAETIFLKKDYFDCVRVFEIFFQHIVDGKIDPEDFYEVTRMGDDYSSKTATLAVLSDELKKRQKPVKAGDPLELIVCKVEGTKLKKGHKFRLRDEFEEGGLEIDYDYYMEKYFKTCDTMVSTVYKDFCNEYDVLKFYAGRKEIKIANGISQNIFRLYKTTGDMTAYSRLLKEEIDYFNSLTEEEIGEDY